MKLWPRSNERRPHFQGGYSKTPMLPVKLCSLSRAQEGCPERF